MLFLLLQKNYEFFFEKQVEISNVAKVHSNKSMAARLLWLLTVLINPFFNGVYFFQAFFSSLKNS